MKDICSECGDRRLLNDSGVCENRHGCEHRQHQHRARTERLLAEMDRQAWHNAAREHHRGWAFPISRGLLDDAMTWGGGESLLNLWKSGHPSQTNRWVDDWLHGDDEDDE